MVNTRGLTRKNQVSKQVSKKTRGVARKPDLVFKNTRGAARHEPEPVLNNISGAALHEPVSNTSGTRKARSTEESNSGVDQHTKFPSIHHLFMKMPHSYKNTWLQSDDLCTVLSCNRLLTLDMKELKKYLLYHESVIPVRYFKHQKYYFYGDPGSSSPNDDYNFCYKLTRSKAIVLNDYHVTTNRPSVQNDNSPIVVDNVQDKSIEADVSSGTNNNVIDDTTNHNIIVDANISSTGYRVSSIDLDRKWTETVLEHSREYANADFILVSDEKIGFELSDTYKCKSCEKEFKKRMSDVSNPTIKKGGKTIFRSECLYGSWFIYQWNIDHKNDRFIVENWISLPYKIYIRKK